MTDKLKHMVAINAAKRNLIECLVLKEALEEETGQTLDLNTLADRLFNFDQFVEKQEQAKAAMEQFGQVLDNLSSNLSELNEAGLEAQAAEAQYQEDIRSLNDLYDQNEAMQDEIERLESATSAAEVEPNQE